MSAVIDGVTDGATDGERQGMAASVAIGALVSIANGSRGDGSLMTAEDMAQIAIGALAVMDAYLPEPLDPVEPDDESADDEACCIKRWGPDDVAQCNRQAVAGLLFCETHKCSITGCPNASADGEEWCSDHLA